MAVTTVNFQNPVKAILLAILRMVRTTKKRLFDLPNVHLDSSMAVKKFVKGVPIYLRNSYSDQVRLREMRKDIYSGNKVLLNRINAEIKPTVLLDFGANIGLSTLALCNKIPSIKIAISVEGERQNFGVLEKNCTEWADFFCVQFRPVHGIISGTEQLMSHAGRLQDGFSASGTFTFSKIEPEKHPDEESETLEASLSKTPMKLLEEYGLLGQPICCKVDIEGGEEDLFLGDTSWLENVVYLTMEVHDRFSIDTWSSSKPFLKALLDYDFAIVPGIDTMFCYNRKFF